MLNHNLNLKTIHFPCLVQILCVSLVFVFNPVNSLRFPCLDNFLNQIPHFPVQWPPCYCIL